VARFGTGPAAAGTNPATSFEVYALTPQRP
jgi:hypothetical protein